MSRFFFFEGISLARTENTISGIPKAGQDIPLVIELFIDGRGIDVYVGMFLQNAFYADGGADEVEAADRRAAAPFEMQAQSDPPVASIGSRMTALRWAMSFASLT